MNFLDSAIGWLAPPICVSCGAEGLAICQTCSITSIVPFGERCFNCSALSQNARTCSKCGGNGAPRFVWITTDYEGDAKELVQRYKFSHQRVAAKPISKLMTETFLEFNSEASTARTKYVVVPLSTATSRVRQRGFDHSAILAKQVARSLNLENIKAMIRLGQSRQVGLSRAERIKQSEDEYLIPKPQAIAGRNILLIDDVVTTGASLRAAAKALRKAGARRVDALVFAKRL